MELMRRLSAAHSVVQTGPSANPVAALKSFMVKQGGIVGVIVGSM